MLCNKPNLFKIKPKTIKRSNIPTSRAEQAAELASPKRGDVDNIFTLPRYSRELRMGRESK